MRKEITVTNTLVNNGPANVNGRAIGQTHTSSTTGGFVQWADFSYDGFGNIATMDDYTNWGSFIRTSYTYAGGVFVNSEEIRENGTGEAFTREFTYDIFGRPKTLKDGNGNITSYSHDLAGRLTRKTNPGGSFSQIEYNDSLRTMVTTDEKGHKVRTSYNRFGFPTLVEDVTGPSTFMLGSYTYDILGRVRAERDWKNTATVYDYDYLDRMLAKSVDPNGSSRTGSLYLEIYKYNDAFSSTLSRVEKQIGGCQSSLDIITAAYTNTHGFTTMTSRWIDNDYQTEHSDHFTHDFLGNTLTALDSSNRLTSYEYNVAGRLTKTTNPDNSIYMASHYVRSRQHEPVMEGI